MRCGLVANQSFPARSSGCALRGGPPARRHGLWERPRAGGQDFVLDAQVCAGIDRPAGVELLDLRGSIPTFMHITDGEFHDVNALDILAPEPGSIYVTDRAYVDFGRLHLMHPAGAFFVTRTKKNLTMHRFYSHSNNRAQGVNADQTVVLDGRYTRHKHPEKLRRVHYKDPDSGRKLLFLTDRTDVDAMTICNPCKSRWQVELFFKNVKQNLRIKRFHGTSENAAKTGHWVAVSVYVLVAIIRQRLGLEMSLHAMLQVLSVTPFEPTDLCRALTKPASERTGEFPDSQFSLFAS